jgi:uncharacterized protein
MGDLKIVSADSHVAEPEWLWKKFLDPKFRDRAPHLVADGKGGETYRIPGHPMPIPITTYCSAGKDPKELKSSGMKASDIFPGGYDGKARVAIQDEDGLSGEVLYPSVGMVVASHEDLEYKRACFQAYNRWISEEFCAAAPNRLFSVGQLLIDANIDRVIEDIREIKQAGHVGVMLTPEPSTWPEKDFDDSMYDPVWAAAADLNLPVSFHVLPGQLRGASSIYRGKHLKLMGYLQAVRQNQDIISLIAFSGLLERHPKLKFVSVEADGGWLPHLLFRMDHAYKFARYWMKAKELEHLPSEYVKRQVYVTHQEDATAFRFKDDLNIKHVMWATDFPHMDSTYPNSLNVLEQITKGNLTSDEVKSVVHDNVVELYDLKLDAA